jgi:hypothetical protein
VCNIILEEGAWEDNSHFASQQFSRVLENADIHYNFTMPCHSSRMIFKECILLCVSTNIIWVSFSCWTEQYTNQLVHFTMHNSSLVIQCRYMFQPIEPSSGDTLQTLYYWIMPPVWIHTYIVLIFVCYNTLTFANHLYMHRFGWDSAGIKSRRVSISANKDCNTISTIRIRSWKDMIKDTM